MISCILVRVSNYLEVVFHFKLFFTNFIYFIISRFYKSEVRTVLFEIGIVLGILKKSYLKLAIHLQDIFLPSFMQIVCYQG